ncbi:MAG TPA: hypothetical protein VF618_10180 [Thermoanaerobaculia bacterium]
MELSDLSYACGLGIHRGKLLDLTPDPEYRLFELLWVGAHRP